MGDVQGSQELPPPLPEAPDVSTLKQETIESYLDLKTFYWL